MFTGIVEEVGTVRRIARRSESGRLTVEAPSLAGDVEIGDSVAVDGACLTVTGADGALIHFDVVTETLRKTTLGDLRSGSVVNLEGALRVGDRVSGHFVMGHVDGVGEIVSRSDDPGQVVFRIRAPESVAPFLIEKGSIAVSGISLTLWDVAPPEFSLAIVPHTLATTTLAAARAGARVNLEGDVMARWIARMAGDRPSSGLTTDRLRDAGYDVG